MLKNPARLSEKNRAGELSFIPGNPTSGPQQGDHRLQIGGGVDARQRIGHRENPDRGVVFQHAQLFERLGLFEGRVILVFEIDFDDIIKLELDLEITEIAAQDPELGPTTTKRKVKTTVRSSS